MTRSAGSGLRVLVALVVVLSVQAHSGHGHASMPMGRGMRREAVEVGKAALTDEAGPWNGFKALLDAQLGDVRAGMTSLKVYLLHFGYIAPTNAPAAGTTFTEEFDNMTQIAIQRYQQSFGLAVTGRLDLNTLTQMIIPRCGREDVINGTLLMLQNGLTNITQHLGVGHYSSFPGSPRWQKKNLTYAIDPASLSAQVSVADTEAAIDAAFAQWQAAITLRFTRVATYTTADIQVSFDAADHGDGNAFDGPLGVLAHAYAPSDGRLHFDQDETWTVNVNRPTSLSAFDLMSVAVHEIGHILGLEHSNVMDAIMYPSISALKAKQTLSADDVAGAQALYGADPTYSPGPPGSPGALGNQGAAVASWRQLRPQEVVASLACGVVLCLLAGRGTL